MFTIVIAASLIIGDAGANSKTNEVEPVSKEIILNSRDDIDITKSFYHFEKIKR